MDPVRLAILLMALAWPALAPPAAGKPVRGIETARSPMRLLASVPDAEAAALIERLLTVPWGGHAASDRVASLWPEGNTDAVGAMMTRMMASISPGFARDAVGP